MKNNIWLEHQEYKNSKLISHEEILKMFIAPDGVLHGIQRDTIGIDETGNIIPGNTYYSATKQCGNNMLHCIVNMDENEHRIQILMSHKLRHKQWNLFKFFNRKKFSFFKKISWIV